MTSSEKLTRRTWRALFGVNSPYSHVDLETVRARHSTLSRFCAAVLGVSLAEAPVREKPQERDKRYPNRRLLKAVTAAFGVVAVVVGVARLHEGDPSSPAVDNDRVAVDATSASSVFAPSLVGTRLVDVADKLPPTVDIVVVDKVEPEAMPGTVIAQNPRPGAELHGSMTLTVSRVSAMSYLIDFPTSSGEWGSTGSTRLSSGFYPRSAINRLDTCAKETSVEVRLPRGFSRFTAQIGVADDAELSAPIEVRVVANGRSVFHRNVYRMPLAVDFEVPDMQQLVFTWTPTSDLRCEETSLVLGEPVLYGTPESVPK